MLNLFRIGSIAECASAALVFFTAAIVGHEAAVGMNSVQWTGAAASILGSITLAMIVHCWPAKPRAKAMERSSD
jgi:hypothetical protein